MRHIESQVLQEEAASEQGSVLAGHSEGGRRAMAPPHAGAASGEMYSFNLSFEELSTAGLEEPRHGNAVWMVSLCVINEDTLILLIKLTLKSHFLT